MGSEGSAELAPEIALAVDRELLPGERIEVSVPGVNRGAIVATGRRIFLAKRGELVPDGNGGHRTWRLDQVRDISFEPDRIAGTIVIHPVDPAARSIVLLFDERIVDDVREAVERLRRLVPTKARVADRAVTPAFGFGVEHEVGVPVMAEPLVSQESGRGFGSS